MKKSAVSLTIAAAVIGALVVASALPRGGAENAGPLGPDDVDARMGNYVRAAKVNGKPIAPDTLRP